MSRDSWITEVLQYCDSLSLGFDIISKSRKFELEQVSNYINKKSVKGQLIKLVVICTHNSRRSHFGQIWLRMAANYYDVNIEAYSGGTEETAFHPNAVEAIKRCGFKITSFENSNPTYSIFFSENSDPIKCYSKKFDHSDNSSNAFGAILVCNDAAEACPFVPGAEKRFVLPYNDPKEFDGTELQGKKYDERCREIGTEMFYIVSKIQ